MPPSPAWPAIRAPILNGIRLGLGVAVIGTLLAETKLSNRGLGYLVIQSYSLTRYERTPSGPPTNAPRCCATKLLECAFM